MLAVPACAILTLGWFGLFLSIAVVGVGVALLLAKFGRRSTMPPIDDNIIEPAAPPVVVSLKDEELAE
jgi:hypothetical protein